MDPSSRTMEIKKNRHSGSNSCPLWLFSPWKIGFPQWIRPQGPWKSRKIDILGQIRARSGCFPHGKSVFRNGSVLKDHGNQEKSTFWVKFVPALVVFPMENRFSAMDPSSRTMEIKKNRHSGSNSCPLWLFS